MADERRAERILVVFGLLGEERDPRVAVEGLPGAPVALEQLAAARVVQRSSSFLRGQGLEQQLGDAIASPTAHHEDGIAAVDGP